MQRHSVRGTKARLRSLASRVASRVPFFYPGRNSIGFSGDYPTWAEASREADGYDNDGILVRVRDALKRAQSTEGGFERDGVVFSSPQWNHGLLSCLLRVAANRRGSLSVLDFGGSLGSTYFQCRDFLGELEHVRWSIVEQAHFVECGRAEFETSELRFFETIREALDAGPIDVALLSGVLPYLPAPYEVLDELERSPIEWLLIDRNPFYAGPTDRLVVQNVPAWVYGKQVRYPAWIFAAESFRARTQQCWRVLVDSPSIDPTMAVDEHCVDFRLLLADRRSRSTPNVEPSTRRGE